MSEFRPPRTPGVKLIFALLIATFLAIQLFTVYLLVYDRQNQSQTAQSSIAEVWGGAQSISGPVLVIPYAATRNETVTENGKQSVKTTTAWHELTLSPDAADISSVVKPDVRKRSIYEAVVYEARNQGEARFVLPADLSRWGTTRAALALDRAEVRFGISDARGLFGAPPVVVADGTPLALQPGKGPRETGGSGFFTAVDASNLGTKPMRVKFDYAVRGNGSITLLPQGGDTRWTVASTWANPSFQGGFLPTERKVAANGFKATWRVGNLALGRTLISTDQSGKTETMPGATGGDDAAARVDLVTPVDLYAQVNRSVKYGFLFIGFTFVALLMFDLIGGVKVSPIEYGLVGAGLVLFFVMLLAFAEVIGFSLAYCVAGGAIIALLTAYASAVLRSWRRGGLIAGLLTALYGVLYVLLSLEDLSLLIGSLLLFAALAAVMYLTRGLDWGGREVRIDV
ncbi:cell envelope integrity protein CreD [Sphingomonas psychrolutea]|uniref:Cell envelope integrity protein CreD n=1 Tax=Sphingomonas psychrolutea TaxID=1259676 RepID=A0ABQ1H1M7_9SPHN|nr:cell envelope integrity protein CreD [Sphingomonas psychrolutea]GGA55677.1 cell envelope integrity protein CreD [Sphingomonas psychrolutea]